MFPLPQAEVYRGHSVKTLVVPIATGVIDARWSRYQFVIMNIVSVTGSIAGGTSSPSLINPLWIQFGGTRRL
jgi:hypothetical protein